MHGDISNKTLALLVVVAVVISLVGTMIVLTRTGSDGVTGMVVSGDTLSQTGTSDAVVDTLLVLTLWNPNVNFGTIYLDDDVDSTAGPAIPWTFENEGNIEIDVGYDLTTPNPFSNPASSTLFLSRDDSIESGGCGLASPGVSMGSWDPATYGVPGVVLYTDQPYQDNQDECDVNLRIVTAFDEDPGAKSWSFTFTAVATP